MGEIVRTRKTSDLTLGAFQWESDMSVPILLRDRWLSVRQMILGKLTMILKGIYLDEMQNLGRTFWSFMKMLTTKRWAHRRI